MWLLVALIVACAPKDETSSTDTVLGETPPPRCGDGVVDPDEACDEGAANDDATPDACRTACVAPSCGDAVVDAGEACDDGGARGGDGCDPRCAAEVGVGESEPNESPSEATRVGEGRVNGALDGGDVDCWAFDVPRCGAVAVTQIEPCGAALNLSLYDPSGARLAAGAPSESACAAVDPADQPGARWMEEGTWTVCAEAVAGAVDGYSLEVALVDASSLVAPPGADLDADGEPDSCDLDRDGDGIGDVDDNCPDVSNGPDTALALPADGYVRTWIAAGPYTGDATTGNCRPAEAARVGEDDVAFAPEVGAAAGDRVWDPTLLDTGLLDFVPDYGWVYAPREAYAAVWLDSDVARDATLSVGADDGVFAWWNGALVLDVASCQGVVADQFQVGVRVEEGANLLLLKVYDQGGGWGLAARLLDESGAAITDLQPGLDPEGAWAPDQTDTDGDGVGDLCE